MNPLSQLMVHYKRLAERFAKLYEAYQRLQEESATLREKNLQLEESHQKSQEESATLREKNLQLHEESAALRDEKVQLHDEIRSLKKLPKRPDVKPSGMHKSAAEKVDGKGRKDGKGKKKKRSKKRRGAKRYSPRATERTVLVEHPNVPEGSVRNGYETYTVQHLVIVPEVLHFKRERWTTPDGESLTAPLPKGVEGHYSADVRRLAVMLYCQGQSTFARVTGLLNEFGVTITQRTLIRLVNEQPKLLEEADEVLEAGLRGALWVNVDDTGARHRANNGFCTVVGNNLFTYFATRETKTRLNFLQVLGGRDARPTLNEAAFEYMRQHKLPAATVGLLQAHDGVEFAGLDEWLQFLETIGVAALRVTPDPVKIATEAAYWGMLIEHRDIDGLVVLSDDAGQFRVGIHALCWVHAERLVHKLLSTSDALRQAQANKQSQIWKLYARLLAYRESPDMAQVACLRQEFDRVFRNPKTGHASLDMLLRRLFGKKDKLLTVLEHPATPLHTNQAERDIRSQVTRRKISSGTRSEAGRDSRDAYLSLLKTCRKVNVSFWDYLGNRFQVTDAPEVPRLATLVAQKTGPPELVS